MVFALRPASRATLTKLTPSPAPGFGEAVCATGEGTAAAKPETGNRKLLPRGRANSRTRSKDSAAADLTVDWRNVRREEDKRVVPSRSWRVLEFAPTLLSASRLCKLRRVCFFGNEAGNRIHPSLALGRPSLFISPGRLIRGVCRPQLLRRES